MSKRQGELFDDVEPKVLELSDIPELLAEWHPTKNGELTPADFGPSSTLYCMVEVCAWS